MSEIIGRCSICGASVTKEDSYSNQNRNIICTHCVREISEHLEMNEALYVMSYIHDQGRENDCQKLFHAMTVVFNKALRVRDDSVNPFTIGIKYKNYLKEAYNLTDDQAMLIVSQNIDKIDACKIPLL